MSSLTLDQARRQMSTIRAELDREVATIRASSGLNETGRRQEIAKAVLAQREKAQSLRSNFEVDNESARATLTGKLFGIPTGADPATVLIHRDAADRAFKLDGPDDAATTLKRALEHGDTVLARAVASHAHGRRWDPVVETYAQRTGVSGDLDALNDLPSGGLSRMAVNVLFGVRTPHEVQTVRGASTDSDLERIVAGEA